MFSAYVKWKFNKLVSLYCHMSNSKSDLLQALIEIHDDPEVDIGLEEVDNVMEKFIPFFLFFPLFFDDLHVLHTNRLFQRL